MPETSKVQLQAPGGSWETLKKIIRAYHAVADEVSPTVEQVAQVAGLQRPVVSGSNNFLRSAGILQEGTNKLTPLATRFATGLSINNQALARGALQDIVRSQESLSYLLNKLKARSPMSLEAFRGEIVVLTGLGANSRNLPFLKAIVDMLQESTLVKVENDEISWQGVYIGSISGRAEIPARQTPTTAQEVTVTRGTLQSTGTVIPISLGVGRLVQVELPSDWTSKDLPKLLKMLEISLSDSEVSTGELK